MVAFSTTTMFFAPLSTYCASRADAGESGAHDDDVGFDGLFDVAVGNGALRRSRSSVRRQRGEADAALASDAPALAASLLLACGENSQPCAPAAMAAVAL